MVDARRSRVLEMQSQSLGAGGNWDGGVASSAVVKGAVGVAQTVGIRLWRGRVAEVGRRMGGSGGSSSSSSGKMRGARVRINCKRKSTVLKE